MRVFFKLLWQSIRDLSRATAELKRLNSRIYALENRILNQEGVLLRVARQQTRILESVAPPVKRIGG